MMIALIKKLFGRPVVNFKELLHRGAIIVDVRSAAEFASGHIPGSRNYPLENIRSKTAALLKSGKPVITVCRSGMRSGMAKNILQAAGVEVYNGGPWTTLKSVIAG